MAINFEKVNKFTNFEITIKEKNNKSSKISEKPVVNYNILYIYIFLDKHALKISMNYYYYFIHKVQFNIISGTYKILKCNEKTM